MAGRFIKITNIGKQRIDIQVQPRGGDFYLDQKQARLFPTKSVILPEDHVMTAQIENFQARRQISVISVQ